MLNNRWWWLYLSLRVIVLRSARILCTPFGEPTSGSSISWPLTPSNLKSDDMSQNLQKHIPSCKQNSKLRSIHVSNSSSYQSNQSLHAYDYHFPEKHTTEFTGNNEQEYLNLGESRKPVYNNETRKGRSNAARRVSKFMQKTWAQKVLSFSKARKG